MYKIVLIRRTIRIKIITTITVGIHNNNSYRNKNNKTNNYKLK